MSCCKRIRPNQDQVKVVNKVKQLTKPSVVNSVYKPNSAVKSNRSPAGTIARQCTNCGTKTIAKICPVCQILI